MYRYLSGLLLATLSLGIFAAPTVEWTGHRTSDLAHPNGNEQAMLWLMNRAKQDPSAEGTWLRTSQDSRIRIGRDLVFNVNKPLLQSEFDSYPAKPPVAFNAELYQAARNHSEFMVSTQSQTHDGQLDKVINSGFSCGWFRGNIFLTADDGLNSHAALNIDWGNAPDGMQPGRGHRLALMSLDKNYTSVGVAAVPNGVEYAVTQNFCTGGGNEHTKFIVGTVWQDNNDNGIYDPGEGRGGVRVMPSNGTYYARTSNSGGYSIPYSGSGTIQVTFSGGGVPQSNRSVAIGGSSVLLDYVAAGASQQQNLLQPILDLLFDDDT